MAITRAIKNLYILETSEKHEILSLLGLAKIRDRLSMKEEVSTVDEWKEEARKLEMQGKKEQAEEIRKSILEVHEPEWEPYTPAKIDELKREALDPDQFNKKAKDLLFHYALVYGDYICLDWLSELKYRKADRYESEWKSVRRKYYGHYEKDDVQAVEKSIREYGADPSLTDNLGQIPLQLALCQSYNDQDRFHTLNPLLADLVTDNIKIRVDGRLIKIANHKVEYFLLHLFIALRMRSLMSVIIIFWQTGG